MHLAASFTMVTNHLHGPERGRAAARGWGLAWDGEGGAALPRPVAAVGTGPWGPSGLDWGRLPGARVAAGARRSARRGPAHGLRRRPARCERGDTAPVPAQPRQCGRGSDTPQARGPSATRAPRALPLTSARPPAPPPPPPRRTAIGCHQKLPPLGLSEANGRRGRG